MRRFHVRFDDWQLVALKSWAEWQGKSLSALVRECIAAEMSKGPVSNSGHVAIAGIGENPHAHGRDHDQFLK